MMPTSFGSLRGSVVAALSLSVLMAPCVAAAQNEEAPEPPGEPEPEPAPEPPAEPAPADEAPQDSLEEQPWSNQEPIEVTVSEPDSAPSEPGKAPPRPGAPPSDTADTDDMAVTVVGVRARRAPGAAHVVRKDTLERTEYDDPHAVLRTVPGVYVRQEDGFGLRPNIGIRGAASDRSKKVTLMEDGILFGPAPYSAPAAYYFPVMTRFTQVRVVKGPAAIAHGPQTVGGAIDFITRPIPATERGEVDAAGGQFAYGKLHAWAGTSTERMGALIEGVHVRSDGFKDLPAGENTGFYRNEVVFKGTVTIDPRARALNELGLKLSYSDELSNETYLGLTDGDFRDDSLQRYGPSKLDRMKWHRTGIAVTHRTQPTRDLEIKTTAYRNDFSRTWRKVNRFGGAALFDVLTDPDTESNRIFVAILRGELDTTNPDELLFIGPNQRDFVSQGIQTRITWDTATGPLAHRVEYGLRLHHDRIERKHTEDAFQVVGGDLVTQDLPTVETALNEASTEAAAFHALDAVTWGPLTVNPGIRIEVMRSTFIDRLVAGGESVERGVAHVVLPGAGAFYSITEELGVLAGVYRGFSPPPPGSRDTTEPELSVNYEAGARYVEGRARAEIIGYYNDYTNLTDICTFSTGCLNENLDRQFSAGSARIYGGEAFAGHDVPLGNTLELPLSASYTLALTEFLNDFRSEDPIFGDVEAGDAIPYVPRHQANVLVGLEHPIAGGYVTGHFVSAMREQAGSAPLDEALATDEQITFDAGAYYRPIAWLRIYTNVRNVFDNRFIVSRRPFGARSNAPRWVQAGVKASF